MKPFVIAFWLIFNKHLLSTYYISGTVQVTMNTMMKDMFPVLEEFIFLQRHFSREIIRRLSDRCGNRGKNKIETLMRSEIIN